MVENQPKPLPIPSLADIQRFWFSVDKRGPGECWPWKGGQDKKGYGIFYFQGKNRRAQRVAFLLQHGRDPYPLDVLHECDNPPCCNGAHLFDGTTQENTADRDQKGRTARGDRSGARTHPERWWQKGELHRRPGAVLTAEQVKEIRELAGYGAYREDIAARYGISIPNVTMILNGTTWAYLPVIPIPPRLKNVATGNRNGSIIHPERLKRGEAVCTAKLTEEQVREIRCIYVGGETTMATLGKRYGISASIVCRVVHRTLWAHIT